MDEDAEMLKRMGLALTEFQVRYRAASLADRVTMKPLLDELTRDYVDYQLRLLKEGIITSAEDLQEMTEIEAAINRAAQTQELLAALAKTIAFVATKV
jgi:hypothetical protein